VFFVRAAKPTAPILFLVPTASYLAYANEHLSFDAQIIQPMTGQPPIVTDIDIEMYKNWEFGLSTYDSWADGNGVCFSSYRRPLINMRPKYRISSMNVPWQFPADLSIIAWLENKNYDYEVITDEDLHRDGLDALKSYKCVLTGTHPEYYSEKMLDATEDYIADGGRYIYMGGNGFYWNVAFRDDEPWIMEVRKLDSGMRAWEARPGEHYLPAPARMTASPPANLIAALAASRPATVERAQIPSRRLKPSDNSPRSTRPTAHSAAVSLSTGLLERLDSIHTPHPQHSNPHSPRRDIHVPLPRFPSLEVCGRRPRRAPSHRHGAGIRKPSQERTCQ
jgi:hypothetical protein